MIVLYPYNENKIKGIIQQQKNDLNNLVKKNQNFGDYSQLETVLNQFFYGDENIQEKDAAFQAIKSDIEAEFNKRWANYQFGDSAGSIINQTLKDGKFLTYDATDKQINELVILLQSIIAEGTTSRKTLNKAVKNIESQINRVKGIKSLNGLLSHYKYQSNLTAYGDAFEYSLAAFNRLINNKTEEEVDKILQDFGKDVLGGVRSALNLKVDFLDPLTKDTLKADKKFSQTFSFDKEGSFLSYNAPTQDKIDIILSLEDSVFNVSAKNMTNLKKNIQIVNGISLFSAMFASSSEDFLGGYITSLYDDKGYESFRKITQLNILVVALMGLGQQKLADTLIINDREKKHIYVRSMPSIITQLMQMSTMPSRYLTITPRTYNSQMREKTMPEEGIRVSTMLLKMHNIKLSASLKPEVLDLNKN